MHPWQLGDICGSAALLGESSEIHKQKECNPNLHAPISHGVLRTVFGNEGA